MNKTFIDRHDCRAETRIERTDRMNIIDFHCDTLTMLRPEESFEKNQRMVDLERLEKAGVRVQCCAAFVPTGRFSESTRDRESMEEFLRIQGVWTRILQQYSGRLIPVCTKEDMEDCFRKEKTGLLLTIEDGGVCGKELANIQKVFDLGVRLITLTWNYENAFGYPNGSEGGLKHSGIEAVEEMNHLGILVDVSHLSDDGFWDVAEVCRGPFIASHSNAREITDHQRNLTDEMIRAVAESGGVIGLNFAPGFLGEGDVSRVSDMVRHVLHIRSKGGADVLALGSDFDGIRGTLEIPGPERLELLWEALYRAGLSEDELDKITYKNGMRVLGEVLPCR